MTGSGDMGRISDGTSDGTSRARYNIAADTVDRHAAERPDALALIVEDEAGTVRRMTLRARSGTVSNRLANVLAAARRRGRRSRRDPAAAGPRDGDRPPRRLPLRRHRGPACSSCSVRMPSSTGSPIRAPSALVTDVANWPKVAEIRDRLPSLRTVVVVDGDGIDGTLDYDATAPRPRPTSGPCDRRRRPRDHHLHVGHDRAAQGRAPCAPLPARAPAGRAPAAGVPASARRPVLDACRLGLDRRLVRHPLPRLALGHPGARPSSPPVRSRARPRPHGAPSRAQRLPASDRAQAHPPVGRPAHRRACALRSGRRAAARRSAVSCSSGAERRSASRSTSSTARPNATSSSPTARG